MGYAVAQVVEALRYKPEGRGFDSQCVIEIFGHFYRPHYSRGVDSASNGNEYQGYLLEVKATLSCGSCLEILGSSNCWSPQGLSRPVQG
jgi:hypothetical protein